MLYTKEGILFLIQIDHVNGELIGHIIDRFYEAGAKNVQVVSAVTKKNRPSYMIFVDGREKDVDAIEKVIVRDLASSGWHRIVTEHRHTNVSVETRKILIETCRGTYEFTVQGKVINDDIENARPEYDCCTELRMFLIRKEGIYVPLCQIIRLVQQVFSEHKDKIIIKEDKENEV